MQDQSNTETEKPQTMHSDPINANGNLYFFDYQQAREIAQQHNRVSTGHATITALQVCFYDGPSQADALNNMVNLPFEQIKSLLLDLPYQPPSKIIFPVDTPNHVIEETYRDFIQSLLGVKQQRAVLMYQLNQKLKRQNPEFDRTSPLRILLQSSRLTTVMQYCSRQLAKALRKLGHEVLLCMEENDMQSFSEYLYLKTQQTFNPHVIFNINHISAPHLAPDVFYFSWWQDPMPAITRGTALPWRERDITLSVSKNFDEYLQHCGCTDIQRQQFCIDDEVFNTNHNIPRENKIVFVGSSYRTRLQNNLSENGVLQDIIKQMEAGEPVGETFLRPLSQRWGVNYHRVYWDLFHYAVRDVTLQWLCRDADIPVEVYGRGWEDDPIVRPYFCGELPHGDAVARVYNSARYALVCHPFEVNSQRLVEAAACGSIPVVFDCRHTAEPPFWDEYCRFFRTADQMQACLHRMDNPDPTGLARSFTYDHLAHFVTDAIHERLNWK